MIIAAFNQEKALVGAFSVIVQPVVEPMDRFSALLFIDRYFCHHCLDIIVPILTVCEESQARQSRIMLWTPLLTGVRVMSWSRNCPYCRVMVSSYQLSCVHNRDSNEG